MRVNLLEVTMLFFHTRDAFREANAGMGRSGDGIWTLINMEYSCGAKVHSQLD